MLARDPPSLMKKHEKTWVGRVWPYHSWPTSWPMTAKTLQGLWYSTLIRNTNPFAPPLKRSTGSIILLAKEALVKPLISRFSFVSSLVGWTSKKIVLKYPANIFSFCGDQFWGISSVKSLVCNSVQGVPGGLQEGLAKDSLTIVCVCVPYIKLTCIRQPLL